MAGLGALAEQYVRSCAAIGRYQPRTAQVNRYLLLAFVEFMDWRDVSELTATDIIRWQESLNGLAVGTKRARCSLIRCFCRWMVEQGYIEVDPSARMVSPKKPRSVPRALPADSVARTLTHCPDARARLIVLLMVQLGLRCIEVSRLQLGDVAPDYSTLLIVGKGHHERLLPITDETREALLEYLAERGWRAGPLIQSYRWVGRGLQAPTISQYVQRWVLAAGVKRGAFDGVSAHAFRHSMASDLVRRGVHIRKVQLALGHEELSSTQVYLAHDTRGLAEAMGGRRYGRASEDVG